MSLQRHPLGSWRKRYESHLQDLQYTWRVVVSGYAYSCHLAQDLHIPRTCGGAAVDSSFHFSQILCAFLTFTFGLKQLSLCCCHFLGHHSSPIRLLCSWRRCCLLPLGGSAVLFTTRVAAAFQTLQPLIGNTENTEHSCPRSPAGCSCAMLFTPPHRAARRTGTWSMSAASCVIETASHDAASPLHEQHGLSRFSPAAGRTWPLPRRLSPLLADSGHLQIRPLNPAGHVLSSLMGEAPSQTAAAQIYSVGHIQAAGLCRRTSSPSQ